MPSTWHLKPKQEALGKQILMNSRGFSHLLMSMHLASLLRMSWHRQPTNSSDQTTPVPMCGRVCRILSRPASTSSLMIALTFPQLSRHWPWQPGQLVVCHCLCSVHPLAVCSLFCVQMIAAVVKVQDGASDLEILCSIFPEWAKDSEITVNSERPTGELMNLYDDSAKRINPKWQLEWDEQHNLTALRLTGCSLSGNIPKDIGRLRMLKELWLDQNELDGEIPPGICQLTKLTSL
ncbi:hypothetical protein BC831DRAFT_224895 [Entophlyctis helioformis]|nr:hypothetical protein BC831DRAFT_224895 [Entophlyctis helioformis]